MIHTPGFIKTGPGIQKLGGGGHKQDGNRIRLFFFFSKYGTRAKSKGGNPCRSTYWEANDRLTSYEIPIYGR
jgi:hypothetical protein